MFRRPLAAAGLALLCAVALHVRSASLAQTPLTSDYFDADRLVVHEVRAAYGCSQVAALAKITFAEFLRDIPAVAAGLATLAATEAPGFYEALAASTKQFTDGMVAEAGTRPVQVTPGITTFTRTPCSA